MDGFEQTNSSSGHPSTSVSFPQCLPLPAHNSMEKNRILNYDSLLKWDSIVELYVIFYKLPLHSQMKYVNPSGLTHLAFLSHSRDSPSSPGLHEYQSVVTKMKFSTLVSYKKHIISLTDYTSHFSGYALLPLHFPSSIHFSF